MPEGIRATFHQTLAASTATSALERVREASGATQRALQVPPGRRAEVRGAWWVYQKLDTLLNFRYVDDTAIDRRSPPPRLVLKRPFGRPETGNDLHYWTTTALGPDATVLRDRLGLRHYAKGSQVFRIGVAIDAAPLRPLFIPTALDSDTHPAWRCPPAGHAHPWGMTRHLGDDAAAEPELLALPDDADPLEATYVGQVATAPPQDYLARRPL